MNDVVSDESRWKHPTAHSVRDFGEFEFIRRLSTVVRGSAAVVGSGDDAAVLDMGGPDFLLATVDMAVQDVHFDLEKIEPIIIGRRALAMNVSDIAAMGGTPSFALVSLALPPTTPSALIEAIYAGLDFEAALTGTGLAGGNITTTNGPLCIDVTLLGRVPRTEVVLRSGARPGDLLMVTGDLGAAAARRAALNLAGPTDQDKDVAWTTLPSVVEPRVAAARGLASAHLARAMLDLSDGLSGDVHHLCRASHVGAVIRGGLLPISPATRATASTLGESMLSLALSGGEDYELLVAVSPDEVELARAAAGDVALTVIGEVVAEEHGVVFLSESGGPIDFALSGWTHF